MKTVSIIARYLLGLMFTVFGLNGFLNFIHQPPPPNPLAIQFFVAISASHFAAFFFAVQLIGGLLLLSGFFVPLALTLLAGTAGLIWMARSYFHRRIGGVTGDCLGATGQLVECYCLLTFVCERSIS